MGPSALAVSEAQKFMTEILGSLGPDNVRLLDGIDIQLHIIPREKRLTDLNEFEWLKGTKADDGRSYDDLRGVGGVKFGKSILYAVAEEMLVRRSGEKPSGFYGGFLESHESGNVVEKFARTNAQRRRLQDAYNTRKDANGPWLNPASYTSSDLHEYFAQVTGAFWGHPLTNNEVDKAMYARTWLRQNDRPIYRLLADVYRAAT